jgi:hypothetical protein
VAESEKKRVEQPNEPGELLYCTILFEPLGGRRQDYIELILDAMNLKTRVIESICFPKHGGLLFQT